MTTFYIQLGSRQHSTDCALNITHALVGQRNEVFGRLDESINRRRFMVGRVAPENRLTPEDEVAIEKHNRTVKSGYYAEQVLAWVESEGAAEAMKAKFPEPEWRADSLKLLPAKNLTYGR